MRNANLSDANLREADLRGANLEGANLSRADLSGAAMGLMTFSVLGYELHTSLQNADLSGANLSGVDLTKTDLSGTILSGAIPPTTALSGTYLKWRNNTLETIVKQANTWKCDSCGKIKEYTHDESEKAEIPRPDTNPEALEYYVPCPFCKKGQMLPPTSNSLQQAFESLLTDSDE